MALALTVNGVAYSFPQTSDENWGDNVTGWATAVTSGMLQKAGGTFALTAEVDFGANFGVKTAYVKSRAASPGSAGIVRLGNNESITWRNAAGNGDLTFKANASDELEFAGTALQSALSVSDSSTIDLALAGAALSASVIAGSLDNSHIASAAAIAYSKLNLAGSIVNADVSASAAIAYSKLNLTGSITNADVSASAAIAYSKLAALTSGRVLVSDGSGLVSASTVTATTLAFLDATSSIQTQLNGKQATGNYITALSGDVVASGPGSAASTIQANVVSNSKLAQVATATFKGRTTAGTGNVEDLTGTQATALLNAFTGDSGSGGVKGLVPAPSSGDAAALKFLKADGTWAATPTASNPNVVTKTAAYTLTASDDMVIADSSGGAFALTLPTAVGNSGKIFRILLKTAGNTVTLNTTSSQTVMGLASGVIKFATANDFLSVISDGSNWQVLTWKIDVSCRMLNTAGTAIGSEAGISFNGADFNAYGIWSGTTGTITIPGKYLITSNVCFVATTYSIGEYMNLSIYKGATVQAQVHSSAESATSIYKSLSVSELVTCVAGDTIQIKVRNDHGTTLATGTGANTVTIRLMDV